MLPISFLVNNCRDINDHTLKLIGVWLVGYKDGDGRDMSSWSSDDYQYDPSLAVGT